MSDKEKKVVPLTEEQLIEKENSLSQRESELTAKESALNERESALNEKENLVSQRESELSGKEADFVQKESALTEKEKSVSQRESELNSANSTVEVVEDVPGLEFKFEGRKFKFLDSAPKEILFNGRGISQKNMVKDENILLQLVGGSALIQEL